MSEKNIILASKSPRRRDILKNAGYEFSVVEADINEALPEHLTPDKAVTEISLRKAEHIKKHCDVNENAVIIAADTMVCLNGKMLGKPKNAEDAFSMLKSLSGVWHEVYTGYSVMSGKRVYTGCEVTRVKFRFLTDKEINRYILSGEPFDKAGAYGIQGKGCVFVERIDGDFFNVMGLPICKISHIIDSGIYT